MTKHTIYTADSKKLHFIESGSVNLVVTSPPYPMVAMWDDMFISQDKSISRNIEEGDGYSAFVKMHKILDVTWNECDRILADGGFVCINIGDSTRTLDDKFALYPNHSMITEFFLTRGYSVLPDIIWCKPSNSPNSFMGSGMYPAGAYVTQGHEYILIFRKGGKRKFSTVEKIRRQKSAYFWEERNIWFSNIWKFSGTKQTIADCDGRSRNASFPFELPYRLVNMYSIVGDTVIDPFCGLGTTNLACMALGRNSIGIDVDEKIAEMARQRLGGSLKELNKRINARLCSHKDFIDTLSEEARAKCYTNEHHNFLVKTRQETEIEISKLGYVERENNSFSVV